jgi:3D (Asp-Asp-Asp) domain-containing protein
VKIFLLQRRYLIVFVSLAIYIIFSSEDLETGDVLGTSVQNGVPVYNDILTEETTISAKTAFNEKIYIEEEIIPFEINYKDDDSIEIGEDKILEEGKNGIKKTKYLVTYWFDEQMDKQLVGVETVPAKTQLTARGTKIVWRELIVDGAKYRYWRKIHVFATKYDGNCEGCRGLTFSGTRVVKGVCAVDPKVIKLGTNFYVEGYGMCRSEDIGGSIKGNWVDLGYEDVTKGEWRTGWTNVYLLTSAPEE